MGGALGSGLISAVISIFAAFVMTLIIPTDDWTWALIAVTTARSLSSISTDALLDELFSTTEVAATVQDERMKRAADGLESDAEGRVYVTAFEQNAVVRLNTDRLYETVVSDPRLL